MTTKDRWMAIIDDIPSCKKTQEPGLAEFIKMIGYRIGCWPYIAKEALLEDPALQQARLNRRRKGGWTTRNAVPRHMGRTNVQEVNSGWALCFRRWRGLRTLCSQTHCLRCSVWDTYDRRTSATAPQLNNWQIEHINWYLAKYIRIHSHVRRLRKLHHMNPNRPRVSAGARSHLGTKRVVVPSMMGGLNRGHTTICGQLTQHHRGTGPG